MNDQDPKPRSGAVAASCSSSIRVRYCECDPMGVAHHAAYIPWLEIGRTDLLRQTGVTYAQLEQAGVFLVIVKLDVKYRRPIRYDDAIDVRTRWVGGSKVKIEHTYELVLAEDGGHGGGRAPRAIGEILAIASTTLACVDREGKIRPLPDWLATA